MLPRKGTAIVKLLNGKQIGGRVLLAKHDKFAQKSFGAPTYSQANVSEVQKEDRQEGESSSEDSCSSAECHALSVENGVFDESLWAGTPVGERLSSQQHQGRVALRSREQCRDCENIDKVKSFESTIDIDKVKSFESTIDIDKVKSFESTIDIDKVRSFESTVDIDKAKSFESTIEIDQVKSFKSAFQEDGPA
ncbi:hypothetical protein FOZ62_019191, partial [Perkinsus olseni]